jgi:hypothetical protein
MRKLFLASLIAATVFISSCKSRAQKLEGKWSVKEYTITNIEDAIKKQLVGTPDSLMEERKKMVDDNISKFTAESKKEIYIFTTDSFDGYRGGRPDKGTWKLSSDGTQLFLMSADNQKPQADVYNVEIIGNKELKFTFKLTPDNTAVYVLEKK